MNYSGRLQAACATLLCLASTQLFAIPQNSNNKSGFHIAPLFLQPKSNFLKYAVFVSGNQPLHQSWHNQEIDPNYSPGFELGGFYALPVSDYNLSLDWTYLNTNDSDSKQASRNVDISTVEFVAPPYDVGPAVFGIKHASGKVNFTFNSILLNIGRIFEYNPNVTVRVFGGLNILQINQNLTATFNDFAGQEPAPTQAYGLPPDPEFYFQTENVSKYLGIGPEIGLNLAYAGSNGFGVTGQFLGTITAGPMSAQDNFTSASTRLRLLGITTSRQSITAPNSTEVVPGIDARAGLFYNRAFHRSFDITIEAGYRFAYYANAIQQIMPQTLVQAGDAVAIPEFSTGTMAINSTAVSYSPFRINGPYINVIFNLT